ncbi:hypothetical protein A3C59_04135 [Candidatus Daviesbacteria bacterium RIFCSPHIGHO2_02_FULL_36_13]|uniref:Methyltransferase type 11 domain-containing protein n=1 Tax=Candidatus Daviesbacteria bacterium RIFCSPHIGHO2_02_FULL_36_13 TaxID=1797768 RepID=A0A1F5JRD4_9BACT|nr:MAG: hypothetical protein A3C59_04135 [Candidatus Daviesbacteria bacterium RIFCSPHIGHO2_02_FULL_36_13]OGE44140.1 MAG: hypothetical protein A3A45_00605 [Candidatus Daviesbacteria bacterium RIFCSPLOWO2_01_FULL_36_8]
MAETILKGYHFEDGDRRVGSDNGLEFFEVSGRGYDQVNHLLAGGLGLLLSHYIRLGTFPIRILDAAGGVGSETALDLGNTFPDQVIVTNLDIAAATEGQLTPNVVASRVNLVETFPNVRDFDLVYSNQFLPWLHRDEQLSRTAMAITNIGRSLAIGGAAILHELAFSGLDPRDSRLMALNLNLSSEGVYILQRSAYGELILGKEPSEPALLLAAYNACQNLEKREMAIEEETGVSRRTNLMKLDLLQYFQRKLVSFTNKSE